MPPCMHYFLLSGMWDISIIKLTNTLAELCCEGTNIAGAIILNCLSEYNEIICMVKCALVR